MDSYSYLSVLISIVLGLGVTNLLSAFAGLVRERARIRMYWPVPVWMLTLFLAHVQMWWAMFGLQNVRHWTFAEFLSVLLQPVSLYITSALIVPNFALEGSIDLEDGYFREKVWFGVGLVAMLVTSIVKNYTLAGAMAPADLAAHGLFLVLALSAVATKSDLVTRIAAPSGLALFLGYIALLFVNLGG